MNSCKTFLFTILLIFFSINFSVSQTTNDYRSNNTNGVWGTASHWQTYNGISWVTASYAPTSSANVITIRSGYPMSVNADVNVDQVVVEPAAILTVNNNTLTIANGTGIDLNVLGIVVVTGNNGDIHINGGAILSFQSGSTYQHARNGGNIPISTWNATSNCLIQGVTNNIPSQISQNLGNLTWNCPSQTDNGQVDEVITTQGNLTIQNTGTGGFIFRNDRANTVGGNFTQSGGTVAIGNNNTRSLTVNGNFTLSGGTFSNTGNGNPGCVLNVSGDFSLLSGILNGGSLLNVYFKGTGTQTFKSGGTVTGTTNYTVNSGSTLQMDAENTVVTGNTFTLLSGATLGIRSNNGITNSGATGNIQVTGARNYNTGANYIYNGSAGQMTGNGLPTAAITGIVTVSNPAGVTPTNNIITNGTLIVNGLLTPTSGQIMSGTGTLTGSGTAQVTRIISGSANFNSQYTISSKILTNLTVEYAGTSAQAVNTITYGNLKINNASGVSLESGSAIVNGNLTLTNGKVMLGNNNIIVAGSINGGGGDSYIVTDGTGTLTRTSVGNGISTLFPVGILTSINPVIITNTGITDDFSVSVKSTFDYLPYDTSKIVKRQWTINESVPEGSNVIISFCFSSADCGSLFNPSSPVSIGKWSGTSWISYSALLAGTDPYSITNTGGSPIMSFSSFVVGNDWITPVENLSSDILSYKLYQNYPNPFNPVTKIKFDIPDSQIGKTSNTKLIVYNILGEVITILLNDHLQPGAYETLWDGSNFPSGIYFYRLTAGDYIETNKMLLIK